MDRLFFLVKLSVFLITITINNGNFSLGFKLSNVCRIQDEYDEYKTIVCNSLKKSLDMSENEIANYRKIKNMTQSTTLYYKLSSPEILDSSQNFTAINNALRKTIELNSDNENIGILIRYSNLKGLDLNTSFSIDDNLYPSSYNVRYRFEIHDSIFQFFLNNQLQISCEDYLKWNLTEPKSILQVRSETSQIDFHIEYVKYSPKPMCPLYFRNVQLWTINFYYQINTYYKKSYLTFSTIKNNDESFLNTKIFQLKTYYNEKIDIDSKSFLNKYVFHDVKILGIFGEINSIEKDIFKSFEQLKVVMFDMMFFGQLSRKGTEWISSINFDLNVNMSDIPELEFNINRTTVIFLNLFVDSNVDRNSINIFQDEDFCLFKDYPFNQLVVFYMKYWKELFVSKYSCTVQWILKTIRLYMKYPNMQLRFYMDGTYSDFLESNISRFEKCDFDKMLENCNRRSFQTKDEWTINDTKETTIVIEFIFILFQPIVCFIGLLFNLLIIYTLSIGDNKNNLTALHYTYLKMASISNIVVLVIGILSPIFECQQRQGIYCPAFHKLVFSQYFKIIIGEFVCSVFKLLSNFFYVGFSICRLSLIGKDHSKLTKFVSELSIFYYILASLIISVCLSVVKIFRYQLNYFSPTEEYPIILVVEQIIKLHQDITIKPRLVKIFNGVADLTTYFLFVPINFILDLVLILDLKKTLSDKQNLDAAKKALILFRVKFLVVAFVLFNILMKLPTTFKTIFDLVNLFNLSSPIAQSHMDNIHDQYCVFARFCPTFEKFASILFIVSISVNIFFYYLFDKNFKSGVNIALSRLTSSEKSHIEYVEALEKINKSNK